ncbi:MAG: nucleoside triphosphate pyrophosphohydrolase, partial [Anaerolineales bacterium]
GKRTQGIIYAVPGHPFVAEATTPAILKEAALQGLTTQVIDGISFLEPLFTALQIDPLPMLTIVDALDLAAAHVPPFPPHQAAVIVQMYSAPVVSDVKLTLMETYPPEHTVKFVHNAGAYNQIVEELALYEIDRSKNIDWMSSLYVPALDKEASFESFQEVIAHLRSPEGCPWDREQTHGTLRPHLLEETYELLDAIDKKDILAMKEELGDLLLQILMHAQIAHEEGEFDLSDVLRAINHKIVSRHPHVFGDVNVTSSSEVLRNWEKIKANERMENGKSDKGLLDSIPRYLPALNQAEQYQQRAARVGFDWKDIGGVLQKVSEELQEIAMAEDIQAKSDEFGDLLFALVNVARWLGIDAESALRTSNERFANRFRYMERQAREKGLDLSKLTLEELDALWEEAKRNMGG